MNFLIATESELLKTKRTATFWLTFFGAAFIPTIFFIMFVTNGEEVGALQKDPWGRYFTTGWQILGFFLLPMYIILTSTLIPQIEVRNNTWKQVFSAPQSVGNIFFSKFLTIHIMILSCFVLFNLLMLLGAVGGSLINSRLTFLEHKLDVGFLLWTNFKVYVSVLGISAIQYALSLRFKGFVAPVGIGLGMVIAGVIALNLHWPHVYKYPYCFPILTVDALRQKNGPFLENHEWNSIGYFITFLALGFFDMKMRKEKG